MTPALALPTHAPSEPVTALQPHPPSQGPSHPSRPPAGLRLNLSALQAAPAAVPGTEEAEIG